MAQENGDNQKSFTFKNNYKSIRLIFNFVLLDVLTSTGTLNVK